MKLKFGTLSYLLLPQQIGYTLGISIGVSLFPSGEPSTCLLSYDMEKILKIKL